MKNKHIFSVIRRNMHILQCPICNGKISLFEEQLKCSSGHCFDPSGSNYVNLLNHSVTKAYNSHLFKARKALTQKDFFSPLSKMLIEVIAQHTSSSNKNKIFLDAGCGEGSLFNQIINQLKINDGSIRSVGIDISKEGIRLAGKHYPETLWMVADLANFPIVDNSIDVITNILSPANYSQFKRILKHGGIIIKVIPGKHYLQELREIFLKERKYLEYSNQKVISLFEKNFRSIECRHISEKVSIDKENNSDLLKMTPLLWHMEENKKEEIGIINKVTLDLHIMIGQNT